MRSYQTSRLLAAASLIALCAGAAQAQEVDELIVTAQKREQAAIDVPIALTAYSGDRLEKLGVADFAELSRFTPGLLVQDQSPNNPGFVMRGITSDSTEATVEPRVSVFQDGVSISKAQGAYVELFDLQRVEVAKGPQSTLYGRGALIGAVNLIQNKADPSAFSASAKVGGGNYGQVNAEGYVNLPVNEQFAVRLAGRLRERDGYVKNALGGDAFASVDTYALRGTLSYRSGDKLSADLIYNYQHDEPTGTSFKSGGFSPASPLTGQVLAGREPWEPAALAAPASFGYGDLGVDRTVQGATALVSYELTDSLTLASVTAWRQFESTEVYDPDGLALPILTGANNGKGNQWSQELRLNYDAGGRFSGFFGADFFHENGSQRAPLQFDERMGLAVLTGQLNAGATGLGFAPTTPAPAAVFNNTAFTGALLQGLAAGLSGNRLLLTPAQAVAIAANLRPNHQETATNASSLDSVDVFGDVTFRVTDKLELSGGLRWTRDEKTTRFTSATIGGRSVLGGVIGAAQLAASGNPVAIGQANAIVGALALPIVQQLPTSALPNFGLTYQPTTNNGDTFSADNEDSSFTWRLVGRYALTEDANLYASYARGRRPEVLQAGPPVTPNAAARFERVEAETVDSYELGFKTHLREQGLRLDGSVYFYDYDNFQTIEQQGTLFVTTNAGKATAYGFEGQAEWAVAEQVDLFATYAYSHARFDGGAYDGNRLRLSPDHTVALGASFRKTALGGEFDFRPTYSWRSKTYFDDNNDLGSFQLPPRVFVADRVQDELQKSYGLVNLRLSYTPEDYPLVVEGFINNALDEEYIIDAGNTGDSLGLPTFIAGAPRMYGVSMTWKFN
ncbi:TonB-dependent receptor [Caulobacter sp. NIBR2454]|uniref:TonB-dependent receptor n=1 Tax=Caulobacter sp. NIBR2454 TaxID=3015996 RepID=UPI0022B6B1D7|nr:TonB-dependent receptor [Caulobacter sp. NIBR2454]